MLDVSLLGSVHLVGVGLLLIALVVGGFSLLQGTTSQQPNLKFRKVFIALQHSALALLILTGIALLASVHFKVEPWFYAKIILFFVMFSSLIKAYKKDVSILLVQRKAGWGIAFIAFIAIYGLVIFKPAFG